MSGPYAAVAFADRSGGVWATRVRTDGRLGSPLPAGENQADVRDVQVAVSERGAVGPSLSANVRLAAASGTGASLGAPATFDAGGFRQTSPTPALQGSTPLVVFTRQLVMQSGVTAEAAVADPISGDSTTLGGAATNGTPAVAHVGDGVLAAWAAAGGGVAVSFAR